MNSTLIALKKRWQALAPRERLALRSLALILALAMLGQLLWTAHERSQRLRRQLPVLEQQLALMRQGQAQWQELENNPAPPLPSLAEPRVQQAILASTGELGGEARLQWEGGGLLRLQGQVPFDSWLQWLGRMQQEFGLRPTELHLQPRGPGRVQVDALLRGPEAP